MRPSDTRPTNLSDDLSDVPDRFPPAAGYLIEMIGGRCRDRTYDPLIKSQLLYQLS